MSRPLGVLFSPLLQRVASAADLVLISIGQKQLVVGGGPVASGHYSWLFLAASGC